MLVSQEWKPPRHGLVKLDKVETASVPSKGKDRCRYRRLVRPAGDIARNVGTEQWRERTKLLKAAKILIVGLTSGSGMEPGVQSQAPETFFNSTAESRKRYCQSCNRPPAGPNPVRGIYKTADLAHFPPVKDLPRLVHRAPQIITAKYRQGRHGQSSDINEVVYRCYRYPRPSPGQYFIPIAHPTTTTTTTTTMPCHTNQTIQLTFFQFLPLTFALTERVIHYTLNYDNAVVAQTNDLTDLMSMTA
uniref:Uncharacterized protein X4G11.020 n=1 Tax=Neurospora crassa TaxID=5141 RepID=Q872C8_NEUCS|nr:putative protein [Neurospora crassa]